VGCARARARGGRPPPPPPGAGAPPRPRRSRARGAWARAARAGGGGRKRDAQVVGASRRAARRAARRPRPLTWPIGASMSGVARGRGLGRGHRARIGGRKEGAEVAQKWASGCGRAPSPTRGPDPATVRAGRPGSERGRVWRACARRRGAFSPVGEVLFSLQGSASTAPARPRAARPCGPSLARSRPVTRESAGPVCPSCKKQPPPSAPPNSTQTRPPPRAPPAAAWLAPRPRSRTAAA